MQGNKRIKELLLEIRLYLSKIEMYRKSMVAKIEQDLNESPDWIQIDEIQTYDGTSFEDYYYDVTYENLNNSRQIEISKQFCNGELVGSQARKLKFTGSDLEY